MNPEHQARVAMEREMPHAQVAVHYLYRRWRLYLDAKELDDATKALARVFVRTIPERSDG